MGLSWLVGWLAGWLVGRLVGWLVYQCLPSNLVALMGYSCGIHLEIMDIPSGNRLYSFG